MRRCPLSRWERHAFFSKFLDPNLFLKRFGGGVWGGTPTSTAFLFGAFSLAFCLKEKAAEWHGLLRENWSLSVSDLLIHHFACGKIVPLPRWGRLRLANLLVKIIKTMYDNGQCGGSKPPPYGVRMRILVFPCDRPGSCEDTSSTLAQRATLPSAVSF